MLAFEEPRARRILRVELGRPKGHVWFIAFAYAERPTLAELLERGLPHPKYDAAAIGALPTATVVDREPAVQLKVARRR